MAEIRAEIGFTGGNSVGAAFDEQEFETFVSAVTEGATDKWYAIGTESGTMYVDLNSITYIREGARSRTIGFAHD